MVSVDVKHHVYLLTYTHAQTLLPTAVPNRSTSRPDVNAPLPHTVTVLKPTPVLIKGGEWDRGGEECASFLTIFWPLKS